MLETISNVSTSLEKKQSSIRRCTGYKMMQSVGLRSANHSLKAVLLLY